VGEGEVYFIGCDGADAVAIGGAGVGGGGMAGRKGGLSVRGGGAVELLLGGVWALGDEAEGVVLLKDGELLFLRLGRWCRWGWGDGFTVDGGEETGVVVVGMKIEGGSRALVTWWSCVGVG